VYIVRILIRFDTYSSGVASPNIWGASKKLGGQNV